MSNTYPPISQLEETFAEAFQLWNVPGAAVGLMKEGQILSARGYGVKEKGKDSPVDIETNFAIGSNTKAFTAACIGKLVEEGKLGWDDKVIEYLPDFAVYDPWVTKEVTIRDILSHRIGVSDVERFLYNTAYSNSEVVHRLRYVQPSVPFRSDFRYSNIAFMVAGEILRAVTGECWETLVKKNIFNPLGMKRSTTNFVDVQNLENVTSPHVSGDTGLLSIHARILDPVHPIPWYDFGSQAAGGITSNVADMLKWIEMFLGKGTYQGNVILNPETVEMMTRPTNLIQSLSGSMAAIAAMNAEINFWAYGLGWFIFDYKGRKLVFHSGQVQGMISLSGFVPQDNLGFVILTNANVSLIQIALCLTICDFFLGGTRNDWSAGCHQMVMQLRQSEEEHMQRLIASQKKEDQPTLPLIEYTGTYDHEYFGEHTITLEGDCLVLRFPPGFAGSLEHWQGNEFLIHWRDDPFEGGFLTFSFDEKNRVIGFNITNEGFFKKH